MANKYTDTQAKNSAQETRGKLKTTHVSKQKPWVIVGTLKLLV